MIRRMLLSGSILIGVAALAGAARAADSDQGASSTTLGEVVVTAQKREEKLQNVPISMEVVSGKKLSDFAANDFKSIVKYTPNVTVESTAGNDVIYIRGFGSPPANFSFDQSVSLYVDGIYAGRSRQAQAPFFDLARVEVLRGPQGALFGKNTPAGAVSVVSAGPTKSLQAEATALYNFDLKGGEVSGFVSGPISDTLGARLAVKVVDEKGYIHNNATGHDDPENKEELARLTLRWAPTDTVDVTLKVDYGHRQMVGGMNVSSSVTGPQDPHDFRYSVDSPLGREGTGATSWMVGATANFQLGDFTLTSVTGYSTFKSNLINDFDQALPGGGTTLNTVYNSYPERFEQESQEVRLLSPKGGKFDYVVGFYVDASNYQLAQFGGFNIPALSYFGLEETDFRQHASTISLFGSGTLHVSDRFRLLGSLRLTETKKRGLFYGHLIYGPFAIRPLTSANGKVAEDNFDPSVTAQYDVAPHVMVYAAYGQGSKSGGFVSNTYGTTNATFTYRPEKSVNYELGIKSTLFDGTMVLNAALYDTQFTNLQVSVYNPTTSTYVTGNAASATSKGIEGSMAWYPVHNLDFTLSAAYQDVKYDDYPGASCLASQTLAQCNPAVPASIAANNLAGHTLPYTSKFSAAFQGHYKWEVAGEYAVDTTVGINGRSSYYDSDDQSPLYGFQKGYAKVDLRVQFAPADEHWHIALVGKNLTDEKTTGSAFKLPSPITPVPRAILYLEETRNVSIEAGMKF